MVQTTEGEDDSIFASERATAEYKSVEKRSGMSNNNMLDLGAIAEEEEEEEPTTTGGTIDLDELLGLPSSKPNVNVSGSKPSLSMPPAPSISSVNASTSEAIDDLLGGLMLGGGGGGGASNASTTVNANNDPFGLNLGNDGNSVIPSVKQKQQQPPSQQKDLAALVGGVDDPFGVVPAQQQQRKRFFRAGGERRRVRPKTCLSRFGCIIRRH